MKDLIRIGSWVSIDGSSMRNAVMKICNTVEFYELLWAKHSTGEWFAGMKTIWKIQWKPKYYLRKIMILQNSYSNVATVAA